MRKRKLPSHLFMVWFFRAVFICAIALLVQNAYADGKYFPEKAYKIPPTIPTQRAILVYKDAIEKLTIESALNGEGEEFGWIIPLPAKPTQFEKASPGLIKTFSLTLQPQIIHDLNESLRLGKERNSVGLYHCPRSQHNSKKHHQDLLKHLVLHFNPKLYTTLMNPLDLFL